MDICSREFGARAAWAATLILGTSAAWLGCSFIGATDLPMAAAFSAAMLLSLDWIETGDRRRLPLAAALLGVAVLAKGLVPLALALPLVWCGRRRWTDLLRLPVVGAFLIVALPWYLLCYLRNGAVFLRTFFWEQHFGRFTTGSLAHGQPFWFYAPVLAAALMPWTPAFVLLARRPLYADAPPPVPVAVAAFRIGLLLVLEEQAAGLSSAARAGRRRLDGNRAGGSRRARWALPAAAFCLMAIPAALPVLPEALAAGLSRAPLPAFQWTWFLRVALALGIYWLERVGRRAVALAIMAVAATAGVVALKLIDLPAIDRAYSARPLWREISARRDSVCIQAMHRSWRYGLNYYSVTPLPDCSQSPRPLQVRQQPGRAPIIRGGHSAQTAP